MPSPEDQTSSASFPMPPESSKRRRQVGWTILLLSCLLFAFSAYRSEERALASRDFKPVYAASACLIDDCHLYNNQDLLAAFLRHGGHAEDLMPFRPYYLGYLPNALFFTVPFVALPWPAARAVWVLLLILALCAACVLVGDLCFPFAPIVSSVLLSMMLFSSKLLILLGQPTTLVVALCCIGVWCFLRQRAEAAGVFCFALSLVIKPHFAVFLLLYFLLAKQGVRRRVWQVVFLAVLLSLPGILWATAEPANRHWYHELRLSLAGIARPGNLSDPGPGNPEAFYMAHLQSVVSLARNDPRFYNPVTYLLFGVLFVIWLVPVIRARSSLAKDLFCIASISALSMLPLYHRVYDSRLLLLCLPATAYLAAQRTRVRYIAPAITGLVILMTFSQVWQAFGIRRLSAWLLSMAAHPSLKNVLLSRPVPCGCLLMVVFYIVCSYRLKPALWSVPEPRLRA